MSASPGTRYRPRAAPRRPSRDARLLSRGRGRYLYKPPFVLPDASVLIGDVYSTPQEDGGKLGLSFDHQYRRYAERVIGWLDRVMNNEVSAAFATSLRRQLIPGMWPDHHQRDNDYELRKHRNTAVRHLNFLQAAGWLHWSAADDDAGASWRTHIWLLDKAAGETWRSYTRTATARENIREVLGEAALRAIDDALGEVYYPEREVVREAIAKSLHGSPDEPQSSLFSDDLQPPCRTTALRDVAPLSLHTAALTSTAGVCASEIDARQRHSTSDWPTTLQGWRTAAGGGVGAGGSGEDRAEALVDLLVQAVRAGAPQVPALRFGYELLAHNEPGLSRRWLRRLEQSLTRADCYALDGAGEVGAGAAWLLARMFERYVRDDDGTVFIVSKDRGGKSPPQTLVGWVVALRREARAWRRAALGLRRGTSC